MLSNKWLHPQCPIMSLGLGSCFKPGMQVILAHVLLAFPESLNCPRHGQWWGRAQRGLLAVNCKPVLTSPHWPAQVTRASPNSRGGEVLRPQRLQWEEWRTEFNNSVLHRRHMWSAYEHRLCLISTSRIIHISDYGVEFHCQASQGQSIFPVLLEANWRISPAQKYNHFTHQSGTVIYKGSFLGINVFLLCFSYQKQILWRWKGTQSNH